MWIPLTHLQRLEAEAIHIFREVAANFANPVMLYSVGKDSSVLLHLAMKAFYPGEAAVSVAACRHDVEVPRDDRLPRPDGGQARLRPVGPYQRGRRSPEHQPVRSRLQQLHPHHEDGGRCARRSTNTASTRPSAGPAATRRSRAPRSASSRSATPSTAGTPSTSGRRCGRSTTPASRQVNRSACSRCPTGPSSISGSTSCRRTSRSCRSISPGERPVVERDGMLIMVDDDRLKLRPGEVVQERMVRFRTLGCYPLTGAIESDADHASTRSSARC